MGNDIALDLVRSAVDRRRGGVEQRRQQIVAATALCFIDAVAAVFIAGVGQRRAGIALRPR
jgi:hypothetical protein